MKTSKNVKIFAYSTVFLSLSLILSYLEVLLPINIGYVGIRVGLTNIITILGFKTIGTIKTLIINILRLIIIGILFANVVRFGISVSGFLLSFVITCIMLDLLNFSIIITSCFAGVAHNIGQIIAVSILLKQKDIFILTPLYIIVGILSGLLVGVITSIIYKKLNLKKIE